MAIVYVPDFFIIFLYLTMFFFSAVLDFCIFFILMYAEKLEYTVAVLVTTLPQGVIAYFVGKNALEGNSSRFNGFCLIVFYSLGFGSLAILIKILIQVSVVTVLEADDRFDEYVHISNEGRGALNMYCFLHSMIKSFPQFFVMCIINEDYSTTKKIGFVELSLCEVHIIINTIIFSLTLASTFPVKISPRVFKSNQRFFMTGVCKFMTAWSACYVHILIFTLTYQSLEYFSLFLHLLKFLIWVFPGWRVVMDRSTSLSLISFATYFILITFSSTIAYIHPFEDQGKLFYFFFGLVQCVYEIYVLYFVCNGNIKTISNFLIMKMLNLAFLSCFGLINYIESDKEEIYKNRHVSQETETKNDWESNEVEESEKQEQ